MRRKKKGIRAFLRRVFRGSRRTVSKKKYNKLLEYYKQLLKASMDRASMDDKVGYPVIEGADYDAAVEKSMEDINAIPVIRCSEIPKFLKSLGISIRG